MYNTPVWVGLVFLSDKTSFMGFWKEHRRAKCPSPLTAWGMHDVRVTSLVILTSIAWLMWSPDFSTARLLVFPLPPPSSEVNHWVEPTLDGEEVGIKFPPPGVKVINIHYLEVFCKEDLSLLPYLFIYSVIYFYRYWLVYYFIPWVNIPILQQLFYGSNGPSCGHLELFQVGACVPLMCIVLSCFAHFHTWGFTHWF